MQIYEVFPASKICCFCNVKINNFFPLSDTRRQCKPQHTTFNNSTPASKGHNVESVAETSKLSATAPEFFPPGFAQYEVKGRSSGHYWRCLDATPNPCTFVVLRDYVTARALAFPLISQLGRFFLFC